MFRKFIRFIIFICLLAIVCYFSLLRLFPLEYSNLIEKYSSEYQVDKNLVYAIAKAESNFNETAESHAGAHGLMQLTDETAIWISNQLEISDFQTETVKKPETNIKLGVWYLSYLINEMEYEDLAILSYNAGINKVKNWIDDNVIEKNSIDITKVPYKETKIYLAKVKVYKKIYELLY